MGEGLQSQKGGAPESLQDKRGKVEEENADSTQTVQFSTERKEASYVLIIIPQDEKQLGNLLYQVAVFNFTQFLIKDFDLQTITSFSAKESALQLSGLETMDEADWYISLMQADSTIHNLLGQLGAKVVAITESNFKLLGTLGIEEYEKSQLPKVAPQPTSRKKGKK